MTESIGGNSAQDHPPAIIVGFEGNGLGVARALHRSGVTSIGIGAQGWHVPYATRRCQVLRCNPWSEEGVIERLASLGPSLGRRAPVLITKDDAVLWLSKHRDKLAEHFDINLPRPATVDLMMSKSRFADLARDEGWPLPVTMEVSDPDELLARLNSVAYPCVLKPAMKTREFRRNSPKKAYLLSSEEELLACYKMVSPWEQSVVIQEWIDGGDEKIAYCLAYYSRDGEPLALFAGRKLRQFPVDCGNTAIAAPAPEEWRARLIDLSRTIFEKLGYRGLGSIEYKMRADGTPVIIEPTVGRTDWQSEVAVLNGTNIPAVAYHDMIGISGPPSAECVAPCKLIDGRAHRKALFSSGWTDRVTFGKWLAERRGRKCYMVWRVSDPGPFLIGNIAGVIRTILRRPVRALRRITGRGG